MLSSSLLALLTITASLVVQPHVDAKPSFTKPPPFTEDSYQDNPKYDLEKFVTIAWRDMSDGMFDLKVFIKSPQSVTKFNDNSWTIKSKVYQASFFAIIGATDFDQHDQLG